ncbi:alpha-L-fucosidase [Caulobacter sp. UNC279MFTsu5.1]|uniref:alpha-L-fucosidase n=1 Tax=Caulobacter sp. UNC279MFTsu5.1 TaxID=1502775 RepID=UPI0008F0B3C2|nr:alpha-L-fucosidase [Caulobacter sp. UNC279MFTsu5.1]SFJ65313.1 alpha-L-fucosidase [Caulobacter sp. UNC279MFTsu5.1]
MRPELHLSRRLLLAGAAASALPGMAFAAALSPYGATPSARQLAWHELETYGFVHFSINTFTDREWGYGDESPALFNPTDFSADQIVAAAKAGGLKALILTAKHHDGFCLWPSRFTEHSIKNSPYKDGKGDIVRELSEACARGGLKFGLYLSPWDRNHADYGRSEYVTYYRNQLRELLTQYGTLFEVWFDGANGGDGYYGGAREVRKIGPNYYNWPSIIAFVHELQPMAVTFDPKGADLRWVGNERGFAGDPCWATMDDGPYTEAKGTSGVRGGSVWWPAEVDVSIRPGWFWHAYEDAEVKSPGRLQKIYFESVGRGTNLLLNLPPDRRGRIPDEDVAALKAWGEARRALFARNLAAGARAQASAARPGHAATAVLDGARDTYWACDAGAAAPELTLTLPEARTFDVVRLREHLPLGLRVTEFALDVWDGGWREIARHQGIGAQRLVRLAAPVATRKLRLRVLDAPAGPAISEVSLFRQPVLVDPPAIQRDRQGLVSIIGDAPGLELRYTVDGAAPTRDALRFTEPFALPEGGEVKAVAIEPASGVASAPARRLFDVRKSDWRIAEASAPGAEALIDDERGTAWRAPSPCVVTLDLGKTRSLAGFILTPAWDRTQGAGAPAGYRVVTSADGAAWTPAGEGEFANIAASLAPQRVVFDRREGRYLRLEVTRTAGGEAQVAFAELDVITVRG